MRYSLPPMQRLSLVLALAAVAACTTPQPCPSPLEECGGQCIDLQSDRRHCGMCFGACLPGEACIGARCTADVRAACPDRIGGAFVTLGDCGTSVKLWVLRTEFIDEAVTFIGSATIAPRTPLLAVVPVTDCDAQWSWHVDDATPSFVTTVTATGCDVCPDDIQAIVAGHLASSGKWCPSSAKVLAVDDRRLP